MRHYKILFLILLLSLCLTACKSGVEIDEKSKDIEEIVEVAIPIVEIEEPNEVEKEGIPSPLSGIYGDEDKVNRRVVGVMFDNHPRARWQSGLKDAEIVYEFQVEGPYTRYLGFYLLNEPENLGPIRSARPYFITKVLEFDSLYVRVGGSEAAKADIRNLGIADIDGLSSSSKVFWRKSHKKMPHNLYTSMDIIRETARERSYRERGEDTKFLFYEEDVDLDGDLAEKIRINYNNENNTEYIYNREERLYFRYKDGERHIDEDDDSFINGKNVIIQKVNTKTIDKEGRLAMDLIGKGEGLYFSNGIKKDIKWVKDSRKGKTIYYDDNGEEIYLNPGVTWIQIVKPSVEIIVN